MNDAGDRSRAEVSPLSDGANDRTRLLAALTSLVVGVALLVVKYYAYVHTGSAAILSDALESIANVVAAAFAIGTLAFARRPADRGHPYGHGKIEYFSATFEGGLISFAAAMIVWYAAYDLVRGADVRQVDLGVAITLGAGLVNAALGWHLVTTGRRLQSITLVADGEHVLSDFKTSVGVVIGLVLVRVTGIAWFDPLAALAVGLNLGWTGVRLVRHAGGGLLDEEDVGLLSRIVAACEIERRPGTIRIHRLRAIRAGRRALADAHVIVPEYWTVEQAHELVDAFEARVLARPEIDGEITFHTDPCHRALCSSCEVTDCPVRRRPFERRPPLTVEEATMSDEVFWGSRTDAGSDAAARPLPPIAEETAR